MASDPAGDFRILKMDGMFHVVFRPDADPEWFRIIASFYTYDRAYSYCDIERVMFYDSESNTSDEEKAGLRTPPIQIDVEKHTIEADLPSLVRDIWQNDNLPEPLPVEDFNDQPENSVVVDAPRLEEPKNYDRRIAEQAIAKQADKPVCVKCGEPRSLGSASQCRKCYVAKPATAEQKAPPSDEPLSDKQLAVYDFFIERANPLHLVEASLKEISDGSGVPHGSISFLLETLEKKQLLESVERGDPKRKSVFRVKAMAQ
jgi:ribosomal protein L40E